LRFYVIKTFKNSAAIYPYVTVNQRGISKLEKEDFSILIDKKISVKVHCVFYLVLLPWYCA
jgi:hypothetical protein